MTKVITGKKVVVIFTRDDDDPKEMMVEVVQNSTANITRVHNGQITHEQRDLPVTEVEI